MRSTTTAGRLNGDIGAALRRLDPAFDTRTYGKATLLNLIDELDDVFEVERLDHGAIYIRRKGESRPSPPVDDGRLPRSASLARPPRPAVPRRTPSLCYWRPTASPTRTATGRSIPSDCSSRPRRWIPNFDSVNYGKEKISHLLEALPTHFILLRQGRACW